MKLHKYPRTPHLPWSPGKTEDDRTLDDCSIFNGKLVVVTHKMDGENTSAYSDGTIHARSLDSRNHSSRNYVKGLIGPKLSLLPEGWRICGENLYARHSVAYDELDSYFNLFSIWNEKNVCLSWPDMQEWAALLDMILVDVVWSGVWDEVICREICASINTDVCEGIVVRNADAFSYTEFNGNVAKYVRSNHVTSDTHWMNQKVVPNGLRCRKKKL